MTGDTSPHFDPTPSAEESLDLVQRARGGDRDALGELFRRHDDRVRRVVRLRMGPNLRNVLDSVDLVQETYLAASRAIASFEPRARGSIVHWLARIAENEVRDAAERWSAARRDLAREVRVDGTRADASRDAAHELAAADATPSREAERNELRELYDASVAELSDRHREVVLLRDYELLDWADVAQLLGGTTHAAQQLHQRASLKLAAVLSAKLGRRES